MSTPKIDKLVQVVSAGGEPTDGQVGEALMEGAALLVSGIKSLERIAAALERIADRP